MVATLLPLDMLSGDSNSITPVEMADAVATSCTNAVDVTIISNPIDDLAQNANYC